MDKSLTRAICSGFGGIALLCQVPFWVSVLFLGEISDGVLKFLYCSIGLVAIIFLVLITHNIIRFAFYLADREQKRRRRSHA